MNYNKLSNEATVIIHGIRMSALNMAFEITKLTGGGLKDVLNSALALEEHLQREIVKSEAEYVAAEAPVVGTEPEPLATPEPTPTALSE